MYKIKIYFVDKEILHHCQCQQYDELWPRVHMKTDD